MSRAGTFNQKSCGQSACDSNGSNCGVAVKFSTHQDIGTLISEDIEKIFLLQDREDRLIYNNPV